MFLGRLASVFSVPKDNPSLVIAQARTFSRQIPVMYAMVIVNSLALAWLHQGIAPDHLSIYVPAALVALSIYRTINHWRFGHQEISGETARKQLRTTMVFAGVLGAVFAGWALSLFKYGDAYTKGQAVFFIGVTCMGILVCLMHLRAAALLLTVAVIGLTVPYLLLMGQTTYTVVAVNLLIVTVAVLFVLSRYSNSFVELIANQDALKAAAEASRELSDRNERLANLDALTGLPNRRSFMAELDRRISEGEAENVAFAVGTIDLDGFKPINDIYGHVAGDRLLRAVGERIAQVERRVFVARLGGDEFGLIIPGDHGSGALKALGDRYCNTLRAPFELEDFTATIGGSIGFAKYPDAASTAEQLFEYADFALYSAKDTARGTTTVFSPEHRSSIDRSNRIRRELQIADLEEELAVHFQFIVDAWSGVPCGAEALARWNSSVLGRVPPGEFISAAEQTGLINRLTRIMLAKTLEAAKDWPGDLTVSFNLSARDIGYRNHIVQLMDIVKASGFPTERLMFEVTESAVVHDLERASETLLLLKSLGVQIALDDFGVGYSSLSYVQALPLDRLKIDRSFVMQIEQSRKSHAVVQTVVDLCNNLRLDCVVEGVETEGQRDLLRQIGCTKIQGYLYHRPMASEDAVKFLRDIPELSRVA